jgi:methionyl-tRNA formyltransferase
MKKHTIVFCGEKPLGLNCLRYLHARVDVNIVAVCTRSNNKPLWYGDNLIPEYCRDNGIQVIPATELEFYDYDVLISVLFPFIIDGSHIKRAKKGAFNLHEAPLPRWRGCNGYSHAILAGDVTYGTTLHIMEPVLDSGDIIAMEIFPIREGETAKELYLRTASHSFDLFRMWLPRIFAGNYKPYAPGRDLESYLNARNSLIPFKEMSADTPLVEVYRRTCALDFVPWEPAHTIRAERKYYFFIGDAADRIFSKDLSSHDSLPMQKLGEIELPESGMVLVKGFSRPLVICDETNYCNRYPLLG